MKKVIVVTDTSANLPAELVQQWDIRLVPSVVTIDGRAFRDGIDISAQEVYRWQREHEQPPRTAAPSVGDFLHVYASAAPTASGIVSIHPSPSLSALHTVARTASELLDGPPVQVIDCHNVAMAQGFVVLAAARAAASGASLEEVMARSREMADKVRLLAVIDTLEYLHRGGRIGAAASLLGSVLQIKPMLYVADGHVEVFAKPRSKHKAVQIMLDHMAQQADGRRLHIAIFHADVPEEAEALRQAVRQRFDCAELYVTEFTPVMGVHTGPGVLGVAFYWE